MRPASTFSIIQLSNSRGISCVMKKKGWACFLPSPPLDVKILSLTVDGRKNRCIPCAYWATAIFAVVSNYSNLFLPFTFFLDCSHFTFGYELIVRPETAGFMKSIRDLFPLV